MNSTRHRQGFTLIELLVASTLFVSLMALLSVAFNRLSNGGQKSLDVLDMHAKADALMRFMEKELRCMPHIAAVHLKPATASDPGTLTFMKQTSNTHLWRSHAGRTVDNINPFHLGQQQCRFVDIIWTRWEWGDGSFKAGESRMNRFKHGVHLDTNHRNIQRFNTELKNVLQLVDLDAAYGMQDNDVEPMVQRHYDFFEGTGTSKASVDVSTGASSATAGQKIQVYEAVGGNFYWTGYRGHWASEAIVGTKALVNTDAPYRTFTKEFQSGDIRHHYTTLSVGSKDPLSDPNAYAVRNEDGKSLNKDRLNLLGASDTDSVGREIYPNQIKELLNGIEFFNLDLVARDGSVIDSADETDRLGDGAASLDISGVEAQSGVGMDKRPIQVRISFIVHAINDEEFDELDVDEDDDTDEPLAAAIRDFVNADSSLTDHDQRMQAFKNKVTSLGHVAILFKQRVQLGY